MSSLYVASNNGATTLATASINATATSFTVASGQGDRFPSPTGGDYTLVTFENGSTREIMCIVGRSTDTFTVGIPGSASADVAGRNYESILNQTAATWTSGAVISCRATASLVALGANSQVTIPTTIHAATAKTPVVDADELPLVDSAASWVIKKFTLSVLWTWIQTHLASPGAIGATTAATLRGTTIESTIATGTAPLIVASTTEVANLKAATSTTAAAVTNGGALNTPASGDLSNCTSNTEAAGNSTTQLATTAFCDAVFGKLVTLTTITATNASWTPNTKTKTMVVLCVGGGMSGNSGVGSGASFGGECGKEKWGLFTSVTGTYAATIGAGGAQVTAPSTLGNPGGNTTFSTLSAYGGRSLSPTWAANGFTKGGNGVGKFGNGGDGQNYGVAYGTTGAANTGDGGGGGSGQSDAAGYGLAGGSGVIYVWEFT